MHLPRRLSTPLLALVLGALSVDKASAQQRSPVPAPSGPGEIRGRIVDATGHGVPIGSITIRRAADTAFAGGALPDPQGNFRVNGLPVGNYVVRVRALGYAPFAKNGLAITAAVPVVELGTITLASAATKLAGQSVTAERDEVILAPDRNSYSVRNMPGVAGGTAIDVLRNTPSVEVDGSDAVSLRGNANVVIQINGRATPLKGDQLAQFLKQLPATALDHIEVASNPNAKSDPEGTAGIINVVLKGDVDIGLSAAVNASTSTNRGLNGSGNVARQSGPLTLYLGGGAYRDQRSVTTSLDRVNLLAPVPASLSSRGTGTNRPLSFYFQARGEYKLSERDVISSESDIYSGTYRRFTNADFRDYDTAGNQIGQFLQILDAVSGGHNQDASVTYRHSPTPKLTTLTAEVNFSRNRFLTDNAIGSRLLQADPSTANVATSDTRDLVGTTLPTTIAQVDWIRPFGELLKLEAGAKHTWRRTEADASSSRLDPATGLFTDLPERTTASNYAERIGAVYAVMSEKRGKVMLQQGLRLEQTNGDFALPLTNGSSDFSTRYGSAFPSAIATYNASATRSTRLSYARRISRPYPQLLSPIPFRADARSIFVGNPTLQPEYTDAYELTLQDAQPWGSLQINPYVRRSAHAFRNIRRVDSLGVSTSTFANVASTLSQGVDVSLSYRKGPLSLSTGGGTYRYSSDAGDLGPAYSVRTIAWNVRMNGTAKVRPTTTLQLFTSYRGPQKTEGGSSLAVVFMNAGIREQLWGKKGSLNVGVNDPFGIMKFGNRLDDGRVIETSEGRFGFRQLTLSISRNFGQEVRLKDRVTQADSGPAPGATP